MRTPRVLCLFVLLTSVCGLSIPMRLGAQQTQPLAGVESSRSRETTRSHHGLGPSRKSDQSGGIKEVIPDRYKERYQQWKTEFLATETGRSQWESYEQTANFVLTITMSKDDRNGAGTGKYKWDDTGKLVAATITLGCRLDEGYPNPIYYPVMNALAPRESSYGINTSILAAAKIAHEFGHIKRAVTMDPTLYRLQNQLIPVYNKILLSNGRNTRDPRLVDLAHQMGGTPVEIWEDREYWGEVNAMLFLRDRITKESEQRALFNRIIRTVDLYAKNYADRFDQVAQLNTALSPQGPKPDDANGKPTK
jgi:hypothetical protein